MALHGILVSKLTKYTPDSSEKICSKQRPGDRADAIHAHPAEETCCRWDRMAFFESSGLSGHSSTAQHVRINLVQQKKITRNDTCSPCSLITSPNRIGPRFPTLTPDSTVVGRLGDPRGSSRVQEGFGAGHLDDFAGLLHHEAELRVVPGTLQLARGGAWDAVWMRDLMAKR